MFDKSKKRFKEYLAQRAGDASSDKNANATGKSFSNYIMQVAAEELQDLTINLVSEKMEHLGFDSNEFWNDEHHCNPFESKFYFHDITRGVVPYCYAASASDIFYRGRFYADEYRSLPPKRFDSFMAQMAEFVMELCQDHAGAIALPDMLLYGAKYFESKEDVEDKAKPISQAIQSFLFIMHNKFRVQGQSPFTNVTILDRPTMEHVFGVCSAAEQDKIIAMQEIFLQEHEKGCSGIPFRFPVTTFNFLAQNGSIVDRHSMDAAIPRIASGKYNVYVSPDPRKFASCCRMINNVGEMYGIDSFGNGGVNVGSTRVVTLVLPALVDSQDMRLTIKLATRKACEALLAHRHVLQDCIDDGFLKFFTHGIESLKKNYFSTVGFIGLFEAAYFHINNKFPSKSMQIEESELFKVADVMQEILQIIKDEITDFGTRFGVPFNSEQIPGESAAIELAKQFGLEYLSNQYIPLDLDVDIFVRAKIAGKLDSLATGGAITHLNIDGVLNEGHASTMIDMAVRFGMTHFAPNPCITVCSECGSNQYGVKTSCNKCCSFNVDHVTRIIGYFVPVSKWRKRE